jgi:hypothetical protein
MGQVIPQYQILTNYGIIPGVKQVGDDPIYSSSSWFDGEILSYLTAGNSNQLVQTSPLATNTNSNYIVGIALGGSANVLNTLLGSSSDGMMGTISNTNALYWRAIDANPFEANLLNTTLAATNLGSQYGIIRTTGLTLGPITAVWSLNSSYTGGSVRAVVLGINKSDAYHGGIGDTNARVIAKFLACYTYWYNTGGGEF